jgi:RNA polymerase sigma-70 factor (ECF subfamily)
MDHSAFAALAERHRRELHVHCYRMLASFDEAEDAVQETFLKAWRGRSGFDGGSQFRAWLYRIATNVCLDMLRRSSRRTSANSHPEVPWLQPYPVAAANSALQRARTTMQSHLPGSRAE